MSSIPSRSGPSRHYDIDHSSRETSIGRYTNNAIHVSDARTLHLQVIQNHASANDRDNLLEPLHKLRKHCSLNATFDAGARFDPPRCTETTRMEIIQRIEQWINHPGSDKVPASLFWLYGGAGAGKSALAQTLSEKFQQKQKLGATFFFFRNEVSRNNGNTLIPTLVWQLVHTFNGLGPFVEQRIHANPDLFTKQHQTQIQELLVEPLLLKSRKELLPRLLGLSEDTPEFRPWLIVVDGLDECKDQEIQCKLLLAIADAIPRIPHPLRFLVTSRPEPHIVRMFNHDRALQAITADRYNLSDDPDADMDIGKFLEKEFAEICRSHCLSRHLPPGWPDKKSISLLVERSSGHFIYAATVIRYIQSENHRPDDRLEVILRLLPPQGPDQPYTQLDALYSLIFQGVESHDQLEKICLVLGMVCVHNHATEVSYCECSTIEGVLGMRAGDVILLLSPILSLVAIENEEVRILHKSLFDYLLDPTRSGHLPMHLDLGRIHELAATYILRERILANHCTIFEFGKFAYHCRFGYLNDTLKDYLRDPDVPYPKCVKTTSERAPKKSTMLSSFLREIISDFFRVLSRDDFDSTGQYHGQYAAQWMSYLRSVDSGCDQVQCSIPSGLTNLKMDSHSVKDSLDTMLKEWKPKNFKPTKVEGTIPARHVGIIQLIEQEHHVWSTFARASTSTANSNTISSLVFSDNFIYSYHFITGTHNHFFDLLIYARHGDAFDDNAAIGYTDIVETMQYCLERAEKFLLSDLFQKYGIFPEGT